jgi:hypothetical protein
LELRNCSLAGAGARSTFRTLWCSAASAIWTVDAASKAEPSIVKIVLRILNLHFQRTWLRGKSPLVCQRLVALDGDGSCRLIRPRPSRSGEQIYWSKIFWIKYSAGERAQPLSRSRICFMDFFWPIRFNGPNRRITREPDEETCICHSPDRIAGMGADQIAAQERDGACRPLCAHWPDRRRQTGLFDEVREFAGPAVTASAGRNQCATGAGAGGAAKRVFRSVLRKKETGRVGAAFPERTATQRASMTGSAFADAAKGPRIRPWAGMFLASRSFRCNLSRRSSASQSHHGLFE